MILNDIKDIGYNKDYSLLHIYTFIHLQNDKNEKSEKRKRKKMKKKEKERKRKKMKKG